MRCIVEKLRSTVAVTAGNVKVMSIRVDSILLVAWMLWNFDNILLLAYIGIKNLLPRPNSKLTCCAIIAMIPYNSAYKRSKLTIGGKNTKEQLKGC